MHNAIHNNIRNIRNKANTREPNRTANVIMICAQSNAAVNHIVRKLLKDGLIGSSAKPDILRLGQSDEYD